MFLRHNGWVYRGFLLALSASILLGVSGCAKSPPRTPTVTALAVPAPPARLLIPVTLPEYVEPEPEPVVVAPEPEPARPAPPRTADKPSETPPAPAVDAPPPPVLQTTANPSAQEERITGLLGSAEQRLKTINFRQLTRAGQEHFRQAQSFIRMANEALRIKNYMYAEQLATKANTVAGLLIKG